MSIPVKGENMTGTIQAKTLHSGKTYLYVYLSYKDPLTGKWKQKTIPTGLEEKGNKRKAQTLIKSTIEKYSYLEDEPVSLTKLSLEITLLEYLQVWLEQKKINVEPATYESYQYRSQGIIRFFEKYHPGIKLRDVTAAILNQFFTYQLQYGKINQKTHKPEPLSVRSTRSQRSILYAVFNQGIIDGFIHTNPALAVQVSSKKNKDFEEELLFLTEEEISGLLTFLAEDIRFKRLLPIAFMGIYMGLRRSEILGLKWNAIDFEQQKLSIQHTVVRAKTVVKKDSLKTKNSSRTLTLFPAAVQCLQKVKAEQETNKKFYGDEYQNACGYIFTWEDGRTYDPNYISASFKKATAAFGRPEITLHKLRHTCASLLINKGWDAKKLQYWLGHSDISTTLNIYAHFNKTRMNDAPDDLDELSQGIRCLF